MGAAANRGTPPVLSSPDFAPYLEMIKKRVQSVWKYPEGMTGSHRINVIFILDRAGKLVRAEVADSTDPRLNNSALQAMRIASPFPPIPESLRSFQARRCG
jgi:TonB family protein